MGTALAILGGLGVFLYGMRVMSGGLQKLAGDRLRAILAAMTRNRFTGIVGGFSITALVQSSSATTVLIVSFANAGLLTLVQAVGLVMGANIGTTVTGWLVSIFGFKVEIAAFALPMIGLGFPLSFLAAERWRNLSEVLVGFGLLFLGLSFLKAGVPTIDPGDASDLAKIDFIQSLTGYGFGSTLLFVLIGTILTVVIQSSSATMAITLVLADQGWIDYELAAAMVLGENLGTTITANLAAIGASRAAVRVARFHSIFNLIGVAWMLAAMPFILDAIPSVTGGDPANIADDRATALALFHTVFNVTNALVLVWFAPKLAALVLRMVPRTFGEAAGPHLSFLSGRLLETPELALVQARRALAEMATACQQMLREVSAALGDPATTGFGSLLDRLALEEKKIDEMEEEIVAFTTELARTGTSSAVGRQVVYLLDAVDDLEGIGDRCLRIGKLAAVRKERQINYGDQAEKELEELAAAVTHLLSEVMRSLDPDKPEVDAERVGDMLGAIRDRVSAMREDHTERMVAASEGRLPLEDAGHAGVREQLLFLDIATELRETAELAWNAESAARRVQLAS